MFSMVVTFDLLLNLQFHNRLPLLIASMVENPIKIRSGCLQVASLVSRITVMEGLFFCTANNSQLHEFKSPPKPWRVFFNSCFEVFVF